MTDSRNSTAKLDGRAQRHNVLGAPGPTRTEARLVTALRCGRQTTGTFVLKLEDWTHRDPVLTEQGSATTEARKVTAQSLQRQ